MCAWQFDSPVPYRGKQEPIVSEEQYNRARETAERIDRQRKRGPSGRSHWLSGVFYCPICGKSMRHNPNPRGNYFRCRGGARGSCPGSKQINVKRAEIIAQNLLRDILGGVLLSGYKKLAEPASPRIETESLKARAEKLNKRLERYSVAFSEGVDSLDEYKANKQRLMPEIESIKKRLAASEANPIPKNGGDEKLTALIQLIDKPTVSAEEKNYAIKQIVAKIMYNAESEQATVFLNY
jgi:hypothetical protein